VARVRAKIIGNVIMLAALSKPESREQKKEVFSEKICGKVFSKKSVYGLNIC